MRFYLLFFVAFLTNAYAKQYPLPSQDELKKQILQAHNQYRTLHQVPSLVWDNKLASYAADYAAACQFKHSYGPYGENLAYGYASPTAAVKRWYQEKADYSYFWPGFSHKTGHFTQVVWKSTKRVGCAYIACNGKNQISGNFLVCEYDPPGNITNRGYFSANVLAERSH